MGFISSIPLALDPSTRVFGDGGAARAAARGWDFLGSAPVPLRPRLRDDFALVAQKRRADGEKLKCCMPMGQGGATPFEKLRCIRQIEDFPKILVSSEHGNAFNRRFYAEHVEGGKFSSCQPAGAAEIFDQAGLIDPKSAIGIYAVAPFVWLIDREKLGDCPVPQNWADLADPAFFGKIVFSGWRNAEGPWRAYNLHFLTAMLRKLGERKFRALLNNVPGLMHSAQMPRFAGTGASIGAVYILPLALADLCPRRDRTLVVFPEDGALAFPLWLTAQAKYRERLASLVDFFFAPETAAFLDKNLYPSLAPGAKPPAGLKLDWLGWDFLRSRAAAGDIKRARQIFVESREILACA